MMKSTIIVCRCEVCGQEAGVALDDLENIPVCHERVMRPVEGKDEVQAAVSEVFSAVTRLAAAALRNTGIACPLGTGPLEDQER